MWKKVVGPVLLMTLIWLSVIGASGYCIFRENEFNTRILRENVSSIRAAVAMQSSVRKLLSEFRSSWADPDHARRPQDAREMESRFAEARDVAFQSAPTNEELELLRKIDTHFADYRKTVDVASMRTAFEGGGDAELLDRLTAETREIVLLCGELVRINEELMDSAIARRSSANGSYAAVGLVFLIAGPILGICVGLRIARNLHRSISRISVTLKDASGDLDQEIGNVQIVPERDASDLSMLDETVQLISLRIRRVLRELHKARQEAIRSDRLAAVGELAAGVAHEIRNPLTSVKLLIQTAARTGQGGIQLEARQAQVVRQEILRMEETIEALLDFARPPQLNRQRHDLRDTILRAVNLVEGRARIEGVTIRRRLSDAPILVDGDAGQLHQVFVNLMINGIESMRRGGELQITTDVAPDTGLCRVTVADRGDGIPSENLGRIFEPFFTTKTRGTGLGLAVSRRIVREHDGTIVAENRAEGGAIFTIALRFAETTHRLAFPDAPISVENPFGIQPLPVRDLDHVASARHR